MAPKVARIIQDLTWALATSILYLIPFKFDFLNSNGAQSLLLLISDPIIIKGSMILFIGLEFKELSPKSTELKLENAKIPDKSLVVVPLLPAYKTFFDSISEFKPFDSISNSYEFSLGIKLILDPSSFKTLRVLRQSSPLL